MPTVLVTGFEPFADAAVNPSSEAARDVANRWPGEATVVAERLPVAFAGAGDALAAALVRHRPDIVIALGVAEGRTAITPERIAINIADARIPDNTGAQPVDVPIVEGAPDGLFSTLPVKAIVRAVREAGIPSELSHSAGTYVCNHVFFRLQHALQRSDARGGFIHVPATPQMRAGFGGATLEQSAITAGVRVAVETALSRTADAVIPGGTLH
ncbi:pyroglutamyl-peptidase I [Demequina sp. SO4-18]|uniref:pyroglutamyl-peptidase I n=1 Tax=Demequina sp. SO4-18 TaxID=3401026 RepID=UPI003B59B8D2